MGATGGYDRHWTIVERVVRIVGACSFVVVALVAVMLCAALLG